MNCPRCQSRVKNWSGDDPMCAFQNGSDFSEHNWNCATMNALRDLVEDTAFAVYCEDQRASLIPVPSEGYYVILGWYKHRGGTEYAAMFTGSSAPTTLTLAFAEAAIAENSRENFDLDWTRKTAAREPK